jgi:hypothetical protein
VDVAWADGFVGEEDLGVILFGDDAAARFVRREEAVAEEEGSDSVPMSSHGGDTTVVVRGIRALVPRRWRLESAEYSTRTRSAVIIVDFRRVWTR